MNRIIVITGPTGVGKTRLSITLAKKYNAEIINADAYTGGFNLQIAWSTGHLAGESISG